MFSALHATAQWPPKDTNQSRINDYQQFSNLQYVSPSLSFFFKGKPVYKMF